MRAVTAATAAAVLQMDRKSFDNLLLRLGPDAVPRGRQGVERRIPVALIEELMLAQDISGAIGAPARESFLLARQLLGRLPHEGTPDISTEFVGSLQLGQFIQLGADLATLRAEMQRRYEVAIESVVRRPRGRPSRRTVDPFQLGDA